MSASPALELAAIHKNFGEGDGVRPVLRGVDLTVVAGELVALLGPSGSGKSTLLHIAGGVDRPTRGRVAVAGTDFGALGETDVTRFRRRHIGFVFQAFHLVPVLTVRENVSLPLELDGRRELDRVDRLIERVGLGGREDEPSDHLSGGEQQRVALARALVTSPELVLADEPTGNLDEDNAGVVLDLLAELAREHDAAVVVATHSVACASRCSRRLGLDHGRVVTL